MSTIDEKLDKFYLIFQEKDKQIDEKNKIIFMLQQRIGELEAKIQTMIALPDYNKEKQQAIEEKRILEEKLAKLTSNLKKVRIVNDKVVKDNPNMTLDFNAVAQGYTTDLIGKFLESKGICNYLVDVGGEIFARGTKPSGELWTIGIEKPAENYDSERSVQIKIHLKDKGIVTSGNYRKYIEKDGVRYSHSIDPVTGYPVEQNLLSATVIADNASWADCLATICMLVGKEKASALLEDQDVEAYFIYVDNDGRIQSEWLNRVD